MTVSPQLMPDTVCVAIDPHKPLGQAVGRAQHVNVVVAALANKTAHIAWAITSHEVAMLLSWRPMWRNINLLNPNIFTEVDHHDF